MIDFGLVDAVDAEAIGTPGQRTFRLRALAGGNRASLWMEKEQLGALGRAISRLLAERAPRREEAAPATTDLGDFGEQPDVEFRVVRLGLDFESDGDGRVLILADDEEALEHGNTPAFRMEVGRGAARALVTQITEVVSAGRPRCPLCGQPLEGDGEHFCPGSNGHGADLEIPTDEVEEG
jgi:uncharacterized repeat protein (TIGR03847 family)